MSRRHMGLGTGPPRGPGHYSEDGRRWRDETLRRWLPTTDQEDVLEIEVDVLGAASGLVSLATVLFGQQGTTYARFVARARSDDPRWPTYGQVGPTFPVTRWSLDDLPAQGAFAQDMGSRLEELHERLVREGWRPAGRGDHWWSRRYTRPVVDLTDAGATTTG